jgi:hypothetical protein
MLDRGELKDWFHSSEIYIEATVAGLGFYLFAVHTGGSPAHSPWGKNPAGITLRRT